MFVERAGEAPVNRPIASPAPSTRNAVIAQDNFSTRHTGSKIYGDSSDRPDALARYQTAAGVLASAWRWSRLASACAATSTHGGGAGDSWLVYASGRSSTRQNARRNRADDPRGARRLHPWRRQPAMKAVPLDLRNPAGRETFVSMRLESERSCASSAAQAGQCGRWRSISLAKRCVQAPS